LLKKVTRRFFKSPCLNISKARSKKSTKIAPKTKRARAGENNYYKRSEFDNKNCKNKDNKNDNQDAFNFDNVYSSLEDSFSDNLNKKIVKLYPKRCELLRVKLKAF
jgi:hypothetical protein